MSHTRHPRSLRTAAFLLSCMAVLLLGTVLKGQSGKFNQPGNILIADQFNNRVIEIDPGGDIVWQWGTILPPAASSAPMTLNESAISH
jgi:hypothetical protein